ncbi:MAG: murein biosynthesis integral membrane protein MurJ [Bacillota bacterium]
MGSGKTIARATVVVLGLSLLSRLAGYGRDASIAYRFGSHGPTDAFFVASLIPNAFLGIIGLGLAAVIVPLFAEYAGQNRRQEASRLMSLVINVATIIIIAFALIGMLGAPVIARMMAGGFQPETLQLTARLITIIMPAVIFMVLAGIFQGILNANNVFGPPAAGPVAMNIVIILAALLAGKYYGVYGLTLGAMAGSVIYMLIQIPALRSMNFRYSLYFNLRDPGLRRVLTMVLPVMLSSSVGMIYTMVDWRLASGLIEGSISSLSFANKLISIPQGLFVTAITTAVFPTLSHMMAGEKRGDMAAILQRAIKMVLLLGIPGTVGLIVLREPVVALLYQRGAFDAHATQMTAFALLFYSVGFAGSCLNLPLTRGFFAMQDTRTPFLVLASTLVVKFLFNILLIRFLQHAGLALATSLTALLNMFVLSWILKRRLPGLFGSSFFPFVAGTTTVSVIMGLAVYLLDGCLAGHFAGGFFPLLTRVCLDIAVGGTVFLFLGFLLRLDELRYLFKMGRGLFQARSQIQK